MNPRPASSMIEVITPIWRRVLQRPSAGVEDNFFEAGGDAPLARELFAEIAQACGRDLPRVLICQAPTLAALAALLEQPTSPRLSPLVLLRAGAEKPPVFMAHGIGGDMMDFSRLAQHLPAPHTIYGMQAKGMDGLDEPLQSVEDMAEFYLDAIRKIQACGPYFLIGYSLGGLVMLEIAQRLWERGENVGLLAMLETYPDMRYLPPGQRMRLMARRARRRVSEVRQLPVREALSRIIPNRFRTSANRRGNEDRQPPGGLSFAEAAEQVREKAELALAIYRPRFYRGKIKFVRAGTPSYFPDDPAAVWAHLAAGFEVETVPGDHVGIVATHFESLAAVLTRYVEESVRQEMSPR